MSSCVVFVISTGVDFNITGVFIQDDGYQDAAKVKVSLVDANNDGIPDDPSGFDSIVTLQDRIVFEYYTNEVSGYQSTRPWIANWGTLLENYTGEIYLYIPLDPNYPSVPTLYGSPFISNTSGLDPLNPVGGQYTYIMYMDQYDLLFINNAAQLADLANKITAYYNAGTIARADVISYFTDKTYLQSTTPPGFGVYDLFEFQSTLDPAYNLHEKIVTEVDPYHFDKNGKVFTQNTTVTNQLPLYFKWSHYSPIDQRVDPAPTNIIDMIVITNGYYTDVINWKNNNGTTATLPVKPTTEELRIQFQNLDQYKMVSDSIVWNSGDFKLLFGAQALPELQAIFKVVKAPSTSVSDNEIKTLVIQAIDIYFDIRNWDFGETFFYTELAAFIHQQLSRTISSVVIVPTNASSQFGNLFEIVASPNQLFMSTATVSNVSIVANLTDQNMRV